MIETHVKIPAAWCLDKNIISGYLSLEAAREIAESDWPEGDLVTIKAFYGMNTEGETFTRVAAIRAKFKERLMKT